MSHSDTIGGERPAGGEPSGLGARLGRFFSPANSPQDQLQETVEFTPEDVVPAEEAWAPRFTTVWRGYDRASVDEYIGALEDELTTVRAEHTPEHAIQDEIDRLGNDTAEILRVAHAKADAIASRAHAQADLLMAEAQAQAEATTRDAEARRRTFDADADLIWRERTRLIDDTRKLAARDRRARRARRGDERSADGERVGGRLGLCRARPAPLLVRGPREIQQLHQ